MFFENEEIRWIFGSSLSEIQLGYLNGVLRALKTFGAIWASSDITAIGLKDPNNPIFESNTILIIKASDKFVFVISNPEVTLRLLALESVELPKELDDVIRAVLITSALNFYSKFYNSELYRKKREFIDFIFQSCLAEISGQKKVVVGKGRLELSPLSLPELILFHLKLRKGLEQHYQEIVQEESWFLVTTPAGAPIYLAYGIDEHNSIVLAAFLSTIYTLSKKIFSLVPSVLIFGLDRLTYLYFLIGKKQNVLALVKQPKTLYYNKHWLQSLKLLPTEVQAEINDVLMTHLTQIWSVDLLKSLSDTKKTYTQIYHELQRMKAKLKARFFTTRSYSRLTKTIIRRALAKKTTLPETVNVLVCGLDEVLIKSLFSSFGDVPIKYSLKNQKTSNLYSYIATVTTVFRKKNIDIQLYFNKTEISMLDNLPALIKDKHVLLVSFQQKNVQSFVDIRMWVERIWEAVNRGYIPTIILNLENIYQNGNDQKSNETVISIEPFVTENQIATLLGGFQSTIMDKSLILYHELHDKSFHDDIKLLLRLIISQYVLYHP